MSGWTDTFESSSLRLFCVEWILRIGARLRLQVAFRELAGPFGHDRSIDCGLCSRIQLFPWRASEVWPSSALSGPEYLEL